MIDLGLKYYELSLEEKYRIVERVRRLLEKEEDIIFAYVHGSFVERRFFRDIDIAIWLKDVTISFYYVVEFPTKVNIGIPLDMQVLNEAPLPFKYHVFTEGTLLISNDENLRAKVTDKVLRMYMDLELLVKREKKIVMN